MSNDINIKALTDNELLELIKKDNKYLDYIYKPYKIACIKYMQKNHVGHLSGPDFEDIYHDALFALTRNIHKEGFNLTSTLKTYLISICKYQCLKAGERTKKHNLLKNKSISENEIITTSENKIITVNGKLVSQDDLIARNKSWSQKHVNYFRKMLKQGGDFEIAGIKYKIELIKMDFEPVKTNPLTAPLNLVNDTEIDTLDEIELASTPQGKALKIALKILEDSGPRCYELLTMYFGFKDKRGALDELTEYFDYKNSDYTKNQKSRCKKTLTELTLENLNN